jgi:hypothetical protein
VFVSVSVYVSAPPTVTVGALATFVNVRFVGSGLHVFVVVALPTAGVVDAVLLKPTFVVLPGVVVSQPTPLDPLATVPGDSVTVAVIVYTWLTLAPMLVVANATFVALPFVSVVIAAHVVVSAPVPVALHVALLIVTPAPKCGVSVNAYVVAVPPLFVVVSLYWIVYWSGFAVGVGPAMNAFTVDTLAGELIVTGAFAQLVVVVLQPLPGGLGGAVLPSAGFAAA